MGFCRYSVTFRAENGGFRILDNGGGKQYYSGRSTTRIINIKFDTEIPYHCTEKSECTYPVSDMMSVQNNFAMVTSSSRLFLKETKFNNVEAIIGMFYKQYEDADLVFHSADDHYDLLGKALK